MDSEACKLCSKPKKLFSTGSYTQWLSCCKCELTAKGRDYVCANCCKRISDDDQKSDQFCACPTPFYLPVDDVQSQTITVCSVCGMQISTGAGSLTQWIFKEGRCQCARPVPKEDPLTRYFQPAFEGLLDKDEEEELEVSESEFPIDRYRPLKILGKGSAGIVYLSQDRLLGKKSAVKVLSDLSPEQLVSFQEEARATAKLNHPNLVRILDFGATESGTPYMVIEHVPGVSLEQYLQDNGPLDEETARKVFAKLSSALEYAHQAEIFHRDIKPSNVLLTEAEDGLNVVIIDFGIAKVKEATGSGIEYQKKTLAGTPLYMAPDTIQGNSHDSQSEVYSLGCVLYECLCGETPYTGDSALEILSSHINKELPPIGEKVEGLSDDLIKIVNKCLSKSKQERYLSMKELENDLLERSEAVSLEPSMQAESMTEDPVFLNPEHEPGTSSSNFKLYAVLGVLIAGILCWALYSLGSFTKDSGDMKFLDKLDKGELVEDNELMWVGKNILLQDSLVIRPGMKGEKLKSLAKYSKRSPRLFSGNPYISDSDMVYIAGLPLEEIDMSQTRIGPDGVKLLSRNRELQVLILNECKNVNDEAVKYLENLPDLKVLALSDTSITDKSFDSIVKIKSLLCLDLGGMSLKGKSLNKLKALPNLITLNVGGTGVSSEAVASLRNLQYVMVTNLGYVDKDVQNLTSLDFIALNIVGNKISDRSLELISKEPMVAYLKLNNNPKLTKTGVMNLMKKKPRSLIDSDFYPTNPMPVVQFTYDPKFYKSGTYAYSNFYMLQKKGVYDFRDWDRLK